jgi:hypothetical protein
MSAKRAGGKQRVHQPGLPWRLQNKGKKKKRKKKKRTEIISFHHAVMATSASTDGKYVIWPTGLLARL